MTEQELQDVIVETARIFRWSVAHFRPARTEKGWRTAAQYDAKGFPDLVLARDREVLFVEVKSEHGKLSPEQIGWLGRLPLDRTFVWRPCDWTGGEIARALR